MELIETSSVRLELGNQLRIVGRAFITSDRFRCSVDHAKCQSEHESF